MGDNEKVLSYGDVILRKSDLKILRGPYHLNDRIIEFYFCYLSNSISPTINFVAPSVSFWILNVPDVDSIKLFVDPLKLPEKELVLFPINDNENFSLAEGGTHWSLLVYDRKKNVFEHYDSSSINKSYARKLFTNIKDFMGPSSASATFIEHFTPRQRNGHDCGLYVLAIAKEICSYRGDTLGEDWESVLKARVTPTAVSEMRNQILEIINDLSNQKGNSVSS
ncbi:hypothetical protein SUGI_0204050 [Cryptomeria japonica]|uniref:NEDD8-specific protease 1 n=1 Tax=Cryptomeria japonica TaxID=3369 RepID=UPI002408AEDF|nr:NEDD8-specific protease 1 [Cryptomeria japonica]XP_057848318.1 NEDD8-specific protease 1 [Cryptomeria japonica]XP_057848319.1 NEDD8-specific protease 1 [Cryptomeria japonica]XP_057848320.1 NEDD8-specific protease 1 [Cryptomeria japonica]XP_057848321.1 NEDD8-specific protease 1 [Cryptomeria japonica]XP_057848322.1 NEDD8-specific protease 1 [Cryptomeria japonica]XP_057848323.1 NEDD8-specific protease 1 [Cryptomeria japonica]XP_057848324.1 NEDD8-specific protease 1 [Cryptomeria japonica]GLJ